MAIASDSDSESEFRATVSVPALSLREVGAKPFPDPFVVTRSPVRLRVGSFATTTNFIILDVLRGNSLLLINLLSPSDEVVASWLPRVVALDGSMTRYESPYLGGVMIRGGTIVIASLDGIVHVNRVYVTTSAASSPSLVVHQSLDNLAYQVAVPVIHGQVSWQAVNDVTSYILELDAGCTAGSSSLQLLSSAAVQASFDAPNAGENCTAMVWPAQQVAGTPVFVLAESKRNSTGPLWCPPGYFYDVTSSTRRCSACSAGEFNPTYSWASHDDACLGCDYDAYSVPGSATCFAAVAHWSFDNSSRPLFDDTLSENDGWLDGPLVSHLSISSATKRFGSGSLSSDGTSRAWGQLPTFDLFCSYTSDCSISPQQSWTISLWFFPSVGGRDHTLLADWFPASHRYLGRVNANMGFDWIMQSSTLTDYGTLSSPSNLFVLNQWHHVVLVWDQFHTVDTSSLSLWLNGTLIGSTLWSSNVSIAVHDGAYNYQTIGYAPDGDVGFQGFLDEIWFFDGPLTKPQILSLFVNNSLTGGPSPILGPGFEDPQLLPLGKQSISLEQLLASHPSPTRRRDPIPLSYYIYDEEPRPYSYPLVPSNRDQERCDMACWAMVTATSASFLVSDSLEEQTDFSSQEILDCAAIITCEGTLLRPEDPRYGTMVAGYSYVTEQSGLCLESSYPYEA